MGARSGPAADADVLVVGGGHTGLLAALGFEGIGLRVTVVDPEGGDLEPPFDGRALALMFGSRPVFEAVAAWASIRPFATPIGAVRVRDVGSGSSVTYDAAEVGDHPFAYGIENRRLRSALWQLARSRAGIEIVAPDRVVGLARRGGSLRVELASGARRAVALVVGADGRRSTIRSLAAIRAQRWAYGQSALTFAVRHERPHEHTVREFLRPVGPLATLPIGPRLTSITWVDRPDAVRWLTDADAKTAIDRLSEETDGILGAMRLDGERRAWPLEGHVAPRPVAPRVALIGDAAHGTHPIHAQGFNLGVRDVAALLDLVGEAAGAGRDPGSSEVLLAYARRRQPDIRLVIGMTDGLARLFSNDIPPLRFVRGLGLSLLDALPPVKALAMRRGMGLGGRDVPAPGHGPEAKSTS